MTDSFLNESLLAAVPNPNCAPQVEMSEVAQPRTPAVSPVPRLSTEFGIFPFQDDSLAPWRRRRGVAECLGTHIRQRLPNRTVGFPMKNRGIQDSSNWRSIVSPFGTVFQERIVATVPHRHTSHEVGQENRSLAENVRTESGIQMSETADRGTPTLESCRK